MVAAGSKRRDGGRGEAYPARVVEDPGSWGSGSAGTGFEGGHRFVVELGPVPPGELRNLMASAETVERYGWTLEPVRLGRGAESGSRVRVLIPGPVGAAVGGRSLASRQLIPVASLALEAIERYRRTTPRTLRLAHGHTLTVGGRTLVMGIVNVTPDSFYDGGRYATTEAAVEQGLRLAAEGADLLDIGGESTRPGAPEVRATEESRRVLPVLRALRKKLDLPLSIDTRKSSVAQAALEAGASLVNDVGGLGDARMRRLVARADAAAVVMHMRGGPRTMQRDTRYDDLRSEVLRFLWQRTREAERAGVGSDQLLVDPGIGFGKSPEGSLELLSHVRELRSLGYPVLLGASRKSFLKALGGGERAEDRLHASVSAAVFASLRGAEIVRVHDVAPTVEALKVADAVRAGVAASRDREGTRARLRRVGRRSVG